MRTTKRSSDGATLIAQACTQPLIIQNNKQTCQFVFTNTLSEAYPSPEALTIILYRVCASLIKLLAR